MLTASTQDDGRAAPDATAPFGPEVRLLEAVPAMRNAVPEEMRNRVGAPLLTFERGKPSFPGPRDAGRPFAAVVVGGAILRETHLGGRTTSELLGAGDVIDLNADDGSIFQPAKTRYVVLEPSRIVLLGDGFRAAARRWPALYEVVIAQQAIQTRRASRHLAALGLSRVEDRLVALFSDLADRWGRVTPDGVRIDLPLTHSLIGQLAGARRPTVSLALTELAAAGRLSRDGASSWLLAHDVPAAA